MKRWRNYAQANTPEYFDKMWLGARPEDSHYDGGRPGELCKHVRSGDRVCDLGPGMFGPGQWLIESTNMAVRVYAVDFSAYVISWLKSRIGKDPRVFLHRAKAEATPFPDSSFDVVTAGELIEHYEDPKILLEEMVRIARHGGWLTVSTVDMHCADAIRNKVEYPEHIWDFTPRDLIDLFEPYGDTEYWRYGNYHMIDCRVDKED